MEVPWTFDEVKDHCTHLEEWAAVLHPTYDDMLGAKNKEQAHFVIDFALQCDALRGKLGLPGKFDPSSMLCEGLIFTHLSDEDMAEVTVRLLQQGADCRQALHKLQVYRPDHIERYRQTVDVLEDWCKEDIKDSGCD